MSLPKICTCPTVLALIKAANASLASLHVIDKRARISTSDNTTKQPSSVACIRFVRLGKSPGMTNRFRSMMAKRGLHWCDTCDAAMVGKNGKCPSCGAKAKGNKRIKEKSVPLNDADDEPKAEVCHLRDKKAQPKESNP